MDTTAQHVAIKAEQPSDEFRAVHLLHEPKEVTLDSVRELANTRDVAKLKVGDSMARKILAELCDSMADATRQGDQRDWLRKIDKLTATSTTASRTTVAIVGQTGAGKSSLINALLDEEELLPTNGVRACTAVASEIVWNEVDDPQKAYRAEIQFRSIQEWDKELNNLFEDIMEDTAAGNEDQPSWRDPTSDAGIAYAKIRAVYPELTHSLLLKSKPERLLKDPRVSQVLGTTKKIAFSTAAELAAELAKYLDSVDKDTDTGPKENTGALALWPLIKVARIYCRSSILSGGVVLVDLPGTVDMNAARNAIAVDYLAQSNAVFVIAPIKRAVDDKSAKELMGKAFKLQLLMDGNYSNVTFICSSCDDINIKESIKSLDKNGRIKHAIARRRALEKLVEDKRVEVHQLEQQIQNLVPWCEFLQKEFKVWRRHNKNIAKGRPVFVPRVPSKRKQMAEDAHNDRGNSDSDSDDDEQVTAEQVKSKLDSLGEQLRTSSAECADAEDRCATAQAELAKLRNEQLKPELDIARLCIQKRNSECKKAIQADFANGVKEIDEAGKDYSNVNIALSNKRDYELVARSLPVFSISSKAYQQLDKGLDHCDDPVPGFINTEDTGIPALQTHTKALTMEDQIQKYKYFLTDFLTLLSSLVVVTAACSQLDALAIGPKPSELTQQQKDVELQNLKTQIDELSQRSTEDVWSITYQLRQQSRQKLSWKNSQAVKAGASKAPAIIARWYTPVVKGGYGLRSNSFKAICRRRGSKTSSPKARDFNTDLLDPYMTQISTCWEELFGDKIPALLDQLVPAMRRELDSFHEQMASRQTLSQCRHASLSFLGKHLVDHEKSFQRAIDTSMSEIQVIQREASRSFYPKMQNAMDDTYAKCFQCSGKGSYQRMKDIMHSAFPEEGGGKVYKVISKAALESIEETFAKIQEDLIGEVYQAIKELLYFDYQQVITAGEMMEASAVALGKCHSILGGVDDRFMSILNKEVDSPAAAQEPKPAGLLDVAASVVAQDSSIT
ncbi:hypothetical protein N0V82_004583 [Gnomoniopsis sp. IMI 355080]|nr:hypothetical protein N0V82_004583 [Gnomoniopsis sp. IMI 355080]